LRWVGRIPKLCRYHGFFVDESHFPANGSKSVKRPGLKEIWRLRSGEKSDQKKNISEVQFHAFFDHSPTKIP